MSGRSLAFMSKLACRSYLEMDRKLSATFFTCLSPGIVVSTSATPWMSVGQEHSIVHLFPHTSPLSVMFVMSRRLCTIAIVAWSIKTILASSFAATLVPSISTEFVTLLVALVASFSWIMYRYCKATGSIVSTLSTNCFDRNQPVSIECEETWSRVNNVYGRASSTRNDWIQMILCVAVIVYLAWANNASATRLLYTRAFANCHFMVSNDPNLKPLIVEIISENYPISHNIDRPTLNAHSFESKFSEKIGSFY